MIRFILIFILTTYQLFALIQIPPSKIEENLWPKGETLLTFFEKYHIPMNVYFDLAETDKELCAEIQAETKFQKQLNQNGKLTQVLIPISEEMQIHVYNTIENNYKLDIIPIESQHIEQTLIIPVSSSPYQDIVSHTGNKALANELIRAYNKSINFTRLQIGDLIAIKYTHKIRLGDFFWYTKYRSSNGRN